MRHMPLRLVGFVATLVFAAAINIAPYNSEPGEHYPFFAPLLDAITLVVTVGGALIFIPRCSWIALAGAVLLTTSLVVRYITRS